MYDERPDDTADESPVPFNPAEQVPEADVKRMVLLTTTSRDHYGRHAGLEDVRNMAYLRGDFWEGDGFGVTGSHKDYQAQQNEVFPLVDTIASALAIDTPQVACQDRRVLSMATPTRQEDATIVGRRIAAPLNKWADEDDLDETVHEGVIHALCFRKGAILKIAWDQGRVVWSLLLPWDVFIDPNCRRIRDAEWIAERFPLHMDDLKERIRSGVYRDPERAIRPDQLPRSIVEDMLPEAAEKRHLRDSGINDHVTLVEFWDFRKRKVYHIHEETKCCLFVTPMPWDNPYIQIRFHAAIGRAEALPLISIVAPTQEDINELVSSRKNVVRRLPRRMLVDRGLFKDEADWSAFTSAKTTQPIPVNLPANETLDGRVWVTPEMPTTYDFNRHLNDAVEHFRFTGGAASFTRGSVENIRTAAEANMVSGAVEGRMLRASKAVMKAVKSGFQRSLEIMRWAMANPAVSGLDVEALHRDTQVDIDLHTWIREVLDAAPTFELHPFSPMMENLQTKRDAVTRVIEAASRVGPMLEAFNWTEVAREMQTLYALRPSIIAGAAAPPSTSAAPPVDPMAPLVDPVAVDGQMPLP